MAHGVPPARIGTFTAALPSMVTMPAMLTDACVVVARNAEKALRVIGPAAFGYPDVPYRPLAGRYGEGIGL